METIIASAITGALALIGVIFTNMQSNKKMEQKLDKAQAVTDCRLEELTREVREHNNFARRMPVVEEQIKNINHKIDFFHNEKAGG
jgi:septation ring formation regulator EzrA